MKFTAIIALIMCLTTALAGFGEYNTKESSTYKLSLLAIDNEGRGRIVDVYITVSTPGRGVVTVIPSNAFSQDTLLSFKLALLYSSLLTGEDYKRLDYTISVQGIAQVEGTSATLLFMVFAISLLRNESFDSLKSATGVIGPGGIVGRVGGIAQKVYAAKYSGLKLVTGPFTANVTDEIYQPVLTVFQAYEKFSETGLFPELNYENMYSPSLTSYFEKVWMDFYNKTNHIVMLLNESMWMDSFLENSLNLLSLSTKYAEVEHFYTASSIAFQAYYYGYSSLLNYSYHTSLTDFENNVLNIKKKIKEARQFIEEQVQLETCYNPLLIDLYMNALKRIEESEEALRAADESVELIHRIGNYSYSLARAETSLAWVNASNIYGRRNCMASPLLDTYLARMHELLSTSKSYYEAMSYLIGFEPAPLTGNSFLDLVYTFKAFEEMAEQLYYNPALIRNEIFPALNNSSIKEILFNSLKTLSVYVMSKLGLVIPSIITMIEFLTDASTMDYRIDYLIVQIMILHAYAYSFLTFTLHNTVEYSPSYLFDPTVIPISLIPFLVILCMTGFSLIILSLRKTD
ncbi:hypothetical protein IMZ38_06465 [Thermosphaera chiliense]|uniref:Lon proteolytic domain-containing protein n=1 Tax=Thermosphaera chiliense TaxID=3402707 RepID=A0A7M1UPR9_9CREN|nr:hypothetical protein [Thermosphaera aggregans]QOR94255.1 hypothetical protein IMZ38_06465 [Thermosphaera aggregans]